MPGQQGSNGISESFSEADENRGIWCGNQIQGIPSKFTVKNKLFVKQV